MPVLAENFAPTIPSVQSPIKIVSTGLEWVMAGESMAKTEFLEHFEHDLMEALESAVDEGYESPTPKALAVARSQADWYADYNWLVSDGGRSKGIRLDSEILPDGSIEVLVTHRVLSGRVLIQIEREAEYLTKIIVEPNLTSRKVRNKVPI